MYVYGCACAGKGWYKSSKDWPNASETRIAWAYPTSPVRNTRFMFAISADDYLCIYIDLFSYLASGYIYCLKAQLPNNMAARSP